MIKGIFFAIVGILVAFSGFVAVQPADYEISRQITINASADKIFPYLNNQKLAEKWGPWLEVDPEAKMSYSGPDVGIGAKASWEGGKQLGTGSATIIESVPNQRVGIKLEYVKPMEMTQDAQYLVSQSGKETTVTWKVQGKNNFVCRAMSVFMNMDKMVGGMFEKGLSNLKTVVEKQ